MRRGPRGRAATGATRSTLRPGEGSIDFARMFRRIEGGGYRGHYMLAFGTLDDMLKGPRDARARRRGLITGLSAREAAQAVSQPPTNSPITPAHSQNTNDRKNHMSCFDVCRDVHPSVPRIRATWLRPAPIPGFNSTRAGQGRRQQGRSRDPRQARGEKVLNARNPGRDSDERDGREEPVREASPAGIGKDRRLDAEEEQADDAEQEHGRPRARHRGRPEPSREVAGQRDEQQRDDQEHGAEIRVPGRVVARRCQRRDPGDDGRRRRSAGGRWPAARPRRSRSSSSARSRRGRIVETALRGRTSTPRRDRVLRCASAAGQIGASRVSRSRRRLAQPRGRRGRRGLDWGADGGIRDDDDRPGNEDRVRRGARRADSVHAAHARLLSWRSASARTAGLTSSTCRSRRCGRRWPGPRVALITTAAPFQPEVGDQGPGAPYNAGAKFYKVYSVPTESLPDLRISHVGYDRLHTSAEDINTYLPLARLKEAAAAGRLGALGPRLTRGAHEPQPSGHDRDRQPRAPAAVPRGRRRRRRARAQLTRVPPDRESGRAAPRGATGSRP